MAQLRQDHAKFAERETEVIVVGPEGPTQFQDYWRENELPFTGLPDPHQTVLKMYGQQFNLFKFGRMPAQVLVDKQGIVRFVHYGDSMQDITRNETVLAIIDSMNQDTSIEASTEES